MKIFIKLFIILSSFDSFAQYDWDSKNWDKESLGFGCSVSGQMTKPVLSMTKLLTERRFDKIRESLNSDLPADQYLATILLEKLSDKKELEISDVELKRIQEIKNSNQQVPVCSGCTYWTEIPLSDLFDTKTKEVISVSADYWFDNYYKIYYKKGKRNN